MNLLEYTRNRAIPDGLTSSIRPSGPQSPREFVAREGDGLLIIWVDKTETRRMGLIRGTRMTTFLSFLSYPTLLYPVGHRAD